jgi:hypothetical protein
MSGSMIDPMSDATLRQLKTLVERAVRPVPAHSRYKRQMREELLAHVTAIYDEELAKLGDESTALARTAERLGEPRALAEQLKQTLGVRNRMAVFFERMDLQPNDSCWQTITKLIWITSCTFVATELGLLPSLLTPSKHLSLGFWIYMAAAVSLFSGGFAYVLFAGSNRIRRAVYGDATCGTAHPPTWRPAVPLLLASLLYLPAFAFGIYWTMVGDWAASMRNLLVGCCFAWMAPVIFVTCARNMAQQVDYQHEWKSLDADE